MKTKKILNELYNDKNNDSPRLGLVKELLRVILGLQTETMERVMKEIIGSESSADVRTMNVRKRIGARSMRYLRNAIDLARDEGSETHNDEDDLDMSKDGDLEPGHQHTRNVQDILRKTGITGSKKGDESSGASERRDIKVRQAAQVEDAKQMATFKTFITELNISVDPQNPDDAVQKIKQHARAGGDRSATLAAKDADDQLKQAQGQDQSSMTKSIDIKIAMLNKQLSQLQKKKAMMLKSQGQQQEAPQREI